MNLSKRSLIRAAGLAVLALPSLARPAGITLPLLPIPIPLPVPITPNVSSTNSTLQQVCGLLQSVTNLTLQQQDLARTCAFLANPNALPGVVGAAYQAIVGQQINALVPQIKLLDVPTDDLLDRLEEVREWQPNDVSGGGAGDSVTFFDGRLGLWANGKINSASRDASPSSFAYAIHDNLVTVGADYRITDSLVAGLAYEGGTTTVPFSNNLGRMDLRDNGLNLYGSLYRGGLFVDVLTGYSNSTLDSTRNIDFSDPNAGETVNQQAFGHSNVRHLTAGIDVGDAVTWHTVTLTPEASLTYREARLNGFTETLSQPNAPGSGLALTYGDTTVSSLQLSAGLRAGITVGTPWMVLQPELHTAIIRELRDSPTIFTASFAAVAGIGGNAATPIAISSGEPDNHFFASGASITTTFGRGFSAFFDYDFLSSTQYISSHSLSIGFRYHPGS